MKTKKNLVFDFDGTLVDTLDLALAFGNENQHRFSKTKIIKEEFRKRSMREALSHIGLPWYKLPQFVIELKQYLKTHLHEASMFPEVSELLEDLRKQGFHLYILSSNSRENIEGVLTRANLQTHFKEIVSDSSIFGKHVVLERLFKSHQLNKTETIYVGDEVRDAEACAKCDVDMIAVAWGWDSFERLRKVRDLPIAQNMAELRSFLLNSDQNTWVKFWEEKWNLNDIRFHQSEVNRHLSQHSDLLGSGPIFVPLCGKSKDMDWLAKQGKKVIGCELTELACESFFKETQRSFEVTTEGSFKVFKDSSVELWCGDFFKLPMEAVATITGIYDRAALIALPKELRAQYVQKIRQIASSSPRFSNLLLISIEYESSDIKGPPFSVTMDEIRQIYSKFSLKILSETQDEELKRNPKFAETKIIERVLSFAKPPNL